MAITANTLNRDASLPTLGPRFEWVSGSGSRAVATERARIRNRILEELYSLTQYWCEVLEDALPEGSWCDDDVRVVFVSRAHLTAAQQASMTAMALEFVHIPTPDD